MKEEFRPVVGYENLYEVSNLGRVKSFSQVRRTLSKDGILSPSKNKKNKLFGYWIVVLYKNGRLKTCRIARLVATAFIPNPNCLPQINHKNSIKTDNKVENLEWCDNRYNQNHFNQTRRTSSKYPGVSWDKESNKWIVFISINTRRKNLGRFQDEFEAAAAYQKAVKILESAG